MAGDLPPRRPSANPEGQNPQGLNPGPTANPGNIAGGSNVPEPQVPRRNCKDLMLPEDSSYQDYIEKGDEQGYFEGDYFQINAKLEVETLRPQIGENDRIIMELTRQLEEAKKTKASKLKKKKKSQSTRRAEIEVTEPATVRIEAQTRTGPMTRQAASAADETQTHATGVQVCRCL